MNVVAKCFDFFASWVLPCRCRRVSFVIWWYSLDVFELKESNSGLGF